MTPTAYPLMMADEGARVRVVGLMGGHGLERRMTEMGLNIGSELVLRQRQGGWLSGSMSLLAHGWHMASLVGALGLAAFVYRSARQHAGDAPYTFGTGNAYGVSLASCITGRKLSHMGTLRSLNPMGLPPIL